MLRRNTAIFTNVIRELGLQYDDIEIKTKAFELQIEIDRKIDVKLIAHWPSCKPVLCIHIACEMLKIPFDKDSIVKLASTTEQNYFSSLSYIKKTLGISTLTFDLLTTRFGCPETLPYLESMFEIFKNNWTLKLTNANIETIDWNDDVFKVAIFWCICKILGGQTQKELIDLPEVTTTRAELNKYTKLVEIHCKSYISELKSQKKIPRRRIAFKKSTSLEKGSKQDKTNDGDKGSKGRKRKFQDEDDNIEKESNDRKHKHVRETKVERTSKTIDKSKRRAEPEEEEVEEKSCIGPMNSQGEMKIVNYWQTQLYYEYLDWREIIMRKISEKNGY